MHAPGAPGTHPTWTSSDKDLVGCSLGAGRLWFTTGFGILNEVYSPRIDLPQIRDLGFIVADGQGFWVEVKRLESYRIVVPQAGVPALEIVHKHPRFELRLRIAPDPQREVLLIEVALLGDAALRPYALLAPHLGGTGHDNVAEAGWYRGRRMLWAEQGPFGLALAAVDSSQCDAWGAASAGYVGASDGWQDFDRHGRLTWQFDTAGPGTVALIGELPRSATLALGIAASRESAATLAVAALCQPFDLAWAAHVGAWQEWHHQVQQPAGLPPALAEQLATSAMVLRVHQDKTFVGAMVASLSVPWGNSNDNIGGYHLVWPRDLVESAGGLLALGAVPEARDILRYLVATQLAAGNWSQNQWLGGAPFWQGCQLDEAAFPVLLAAALAEREALDGIEVAPMIRRALAFIARVGPASEQDRWEEDAGINAFTLATCIAALVCGAPWLAEPARGWALRIADDWNSRIEEWTAVHDTALARAHGLAGYYVRIAPPVDTDGLRHLERILAIKNQIEDPGLAAEDQVATDFLHLVRMGLRDAGDPLMLDTIKLADALLRVETPAGSAWHRYVGDGYGERADGSPFDGAGRGRAWPLLSGERGHYELAAGRDPLPYLQSMAAMVGRCGLIPEQVWDEPSSPRPWLTLGKPTGSAMPLVWAHAEFVKLAASRALGRPFDRPEAVWRRYGGRRPAPAEALWSPRAPIARMRSGQALWLYLPRPARVHHGIDGWQGVADSETTDNGLGQYVLALPTSGLAAGTRIDFTFLWTDSGSWEGQDYRVDIN
ncbi:glycoside hydrolase family 15 protein [Ramlibacter sp.]|uniref:glycoside hydrolase family 15 protein n=1 Tax=Ramlibacter sp. TaxID=1917967 RepID=UPI0026334A31|nr:glycoside hydrolase family 15 protein [Ramlibacter sp.]MDB5957727.1 glycosyl hydrolase [Ramlibacter sp.]